MRSPLAPALTLPFTPLTSLLTLSLLLNLVSAQTYILHHRLLPTTTGTSSSLPQLKSYGSISLSNSTVTVPGAQTELIATFRKLPNAEEISLDALRAESEAIGDEKGERRGQGGWYQVALEDPEAHGGEEGWALAVTKACYLPHSPLTLTIHHSASLPPSIDLSANGIPRDGACPDSSTGSAEASMRGLQVRVQRAARAYSPTPASPKPLTLTPDGQPAPPPVEKTFLQKYWLPLIGVAFFLISQLAPEEKRGQAAGAK